MRGTEAVASSAWLHNMSVPSTSTLAVRREWLGGTCFEVWPRVQTATAPWIAPRSWAARGLRDHGPSALLALLLEPPEPVASWQARVTRARRSVERQGNVRVRLDEAVTGVLTDAGVPRRVGVFVPRGELVPPGVTRLGFAASLAVLGHRSGPLFLPGRRVDGSLIDLAEVLLVFPDDVVTSASRLPHS